MNLPIQIHDHGFRHLEIGSFAKPVVLAQECEISHDFRHQILTSDESPDYFKIILICHIRQEQGGEAVGTWVKAELFGVFSVPTDLPEEKRPPTVTFNGLSILYGLLRGVISTLTASFEVGKFTLPTVSPMELAKQNLPAE